MLRKVHIVQETYLFSFVFSKLISDFSLHKSITSIIIKQTGDMSH